MGFNNKNNSSRRKFIEKAAGAALCTCAYFSLGGQTFPEEGRITYGKEHLAAACGTYCGACPAYLAKHSTEEQNKKRLEKRSTCITSLPQKGIPDPRWMDGLLCDGCLSGGTLAPHCQNCAIRKCASDKQSDSRCSVCDELPCPRITGLINMGAYLHRKEYLPNLEKISEMGVRKWSEYEEERWRCPKCGNPMSWYDLECVSCGEERSDQLFSLT